VSREGEMATDTARPAASSYLIYLIYLIYLT